MSKGQTERLNKLKIQRGQAKTRSYMRKWPETGKTARIKMMTDDRQKKKKLTQVNKNELEMKMNEK